MKQLFLFSFFVLSPLIFTHASDLASSTESVKNQLVESSNKLSKMGGVIQKPQEGRFLFITSQNEYSKEEIRELASIFSRQIHFSIEVIQGTSFKFDQLAADMSNLKYSLAIYLTTSESLPMSLVANEARWAMINVRLVAMGASNRDVKFKRLQREISRVYKCLLLTGSKDQSVAAVREGSDLDKIKTDPVSGQDLFAMMQALPSFGLKPARFFPYKIACQQGWAPAPTNDVQKTIWAEVYEKPTNPLKITFDPKTDTK